MRVFLRYQSQRTQVASCTHSMNRDRPTFSPAQNLGRHSNNLGYFAGVKGEEQWKIPLIVGSYCTGLVLPLTKTHKDLGLHGDGIHKAGSQDYLQVFFFPVLDALKKKKKKSCKNEHILCSTDAVYSQTLPKHLY